MKTEKALFKDMPSSDHRKHVQIVIFFPWHKFHKQLRKVGPRTYRFSKFCCEFILTLQM